MEPKREENNENWTVTQNGVTLTRKQICVLLDRTFRCGHSTQGSPLEYYGPIPRLVDPPKRKKPRPVGD
jgi:hypothetical protein